MMNQFTRSELIFGREAMERLHDSRVAVFGLGGVGGYVVEALARAGVGALDLIDNDTVSLTNLNRQLFALHSTIGRYKVDVARERVTDINPMAVVRAYQCFFLPETAAQFDFAQYDYVVDAIDTVTGKLGIIEHAVSCGVPVISCMGTGNKVNPSLLRVADIADTKGDPLARVMRKELRRRGIEHLKVVYSTEEPAALDAALEAACMAEKDAEARDAAMASLQDVTSATTQKMPGTAASRRSVPGSTSFVPPTAGLLIASEVIKDLMAFC